ncbi:hypothetical protein EJB05_11487, partial [Eragrostis curvula]
MASQRLLLLLALLLLTLLATAVMAEGGDVAVVAGSADAANATGDAEPPAGGAALDVRARKWWRFPPAEDLVRGSERRVPNSSDPLHNR